MWILWELGISYRWEYYESWALQMWSSWGLDIVSWALWMWIFWKLSFANIDFIWKMRSKDEVCDVKMSVMEILKMNSWVEWNLVETSDGMNFPGELQSEIKRWNLCCKLQMKCKLKWWHFCVKMESVMQTADEMRTEIVTSAKNISVTLSQG